MTILRSTPARRRALPAGYVRLMNELPLLPLRNAKDHSKAVAMVHALALREDTLDAGEQAYLEVLEAVVEQYEATHHALETRDLTPTHAIRMLVENAGMTVSDLGRLLGSKGAASELLSGKRAEPSKAQIAKLCERFNVNASLFLLEKKSSASAA